MVKFELTCCLKGDKFSEVDIKNNTGIILHSVKEYEKDSIDIPVRKFKKVVTITPEDNNIFNDDYNIQIKIFTDFMKSNIETIKQSGCELIILLLTIKYLDQCNFEFNNDLLKSVSETFDDLYITCYEVEAF